MPRVAPSSPRVGVVNTKLGQSARLRYAISRAEISELKGGLLNGSLVRIKDVAAKVATEYSEVLKNSWALTEPLFVNEPDKHRMNLAGLLKDVKPGNRRRTRSFNQRDISRALRAAKAAGVEVREITPDGRIILGTPSPSNGAGDDDILARLA